MVPCADQMDFSLRSVAASNGLRTGWLLGLLSCEPLSLELKVREPWACAHGLEPNSPSRAELTLEAVGER